MNIEKPSHVSTANTTDWSGNMNGVVVSESAKRQLAVKVLESKAHLSGSRRGPSFLDSFTDIGDGH